MKAILLTAAILVSSLCHAGGIVPIPIVTGSGGGGAPKEYLIGFYIMLNAVLIAVAIVRGIMYASGKRYSYKSYHNKKRHSMLQYVFLDIGHDMNMLAIMLIAINAIALLIAGGGWITKTFLIN